MIIVYCIYGRASIEIVHIFINYIQFIEGKNKMRVTCVDGAIMRGDAREIVAFFPQFVAA